MSYLMLGRVVMIDDPRRLGRIQCLIPDLGLMTEPSDWIRRSALAGTHKVPGLNETVLLEGFMSGPSLTLFYVGHISAAAPDDVPPGQDEVASPSDYARSTVEELGEAMARLIANFETKMVQMKVLGFSTPAGIELDVENNRLRLMKGNDDVILDEDGANLAMLNDEVIVETSDGPASGFIVSGSASARSRFIR
jgi:hypothetical protein